MSDALFEAFVDALEDYLGARREFADKVRSMDGLRGEEVRSAFPSSYERLEASREKAEEAFNLAVLGIPWLPTYEPVSDSDGESIDACEGCHRPFGNAEAVYITLDGVRLCRRCYNAVPTKR